MVDVYTQYLFQKAMSEQYAQEQEMKNAQYQQMLEEANWNKMMRPILLKQMGLIEENGVLRAMTEQEKLAGMTPDERMAYETDKLLAARQAKAARGELGTPGYIENELARQQEQQQIASSQRLGARGAQVSTPGIRTKANMMSNAAGVRSNYAYGQEQQGLGLLSNSANYLGGLAQRNINTYGGYANSGMSLIPQGQMAQQPYTYGMSLLGSYNNMMKDRNSAARTGAMQGIGQGIGTGLSMYLGGR